MLRRLQERIRAHGSLAKALVSFVLGTNSVFGTVTPPRQQPSIPDRVAAVRASLKSMQEPLTPAFPPVSKQEPGKDLAQWINWGNWGNWANWNNWANWANWLNWRNF